MNNPRRLALIQRIGFVLAVIFAGLTLTIANAAHGDAEKAARQAKDTAAAVAVQTEQFRREGVVNDLRSCVRSNDSRRSARFNSRTLGELLDAITPNQPDPPRSLFERVRRELRQNFTINSSVNCKALVEGVDLLPPAQVAGILKDRGRAPQPHEETP